MFLCTNDRRGRSDQKTEKHVSRLLKRATSSKMAHREIVGDCCMKTMSAREAKNGFGLMIDTARAEPVRIEKHGRGVVMVISVEEYERLTVGQTELAWGIWTGG